MKCTIIPTVVSLDEFNVFTGDYESSPEVDYQKSQFLKTAEEIVEDYLGYKILASDRTEILTGLDQRKVYLHSLPVDYVYSVRINGCELAQDVDFVWNFDSVYLNRKPCPKDEVVVYYSAGWSQTSVPAIVKSSILRISTLLKSEANQNISVTSVSYSDGSRSFVNYTNFNKYLQPLRSLKSTWI